MKQDRRAFVDSFQRGLARLADPRAGAAILIPLVEGPAGLEILFEVRSPRLRTQPGEVCCPGGKVELPEGPREAALRETCEELLVAPGQIEIVGSLGMLMGPAGLPLYAYVGFLSDYVGTFSADEVEGTFTVPLAWFMAHEPELHDAHLVEDPPVDFPFDLVPRSLGSDRLRRRFDLPFYRGTDPLVWGATARAVHRLTDVLHAAEG